MPVVTAKEGAHKARKEGNYKAHKEELFFSFVLFVRFVVQGFYAFYPCFRVKPRLRGPAQSGGDTSDQADRTGGEVDSVNCNFSLNFFTRQISLVIREPPGWRG